MKYWRGYLTAAIMGFFSLALMQFAKTHTTLIDMVYPYISRMMQEFLAAWSGGVDFCLWQVLAVTGILAILASIVLMVIFRWNIIQWLGWVLAAGSVVFFLHTGVYGLNQYAGPISEDMKLNTTGYTREELTDATIYYRDKANELSAKVTRDSSGNLTAPDFDLLAESAGEGFDHLTYNLYYSVFAGKRQPVKQLGFDHIFASMGIDGFTFPLTGEAAVNPNAPAVSIPFAMCREMAHRLAIAHEDDANFAAFLAARFNSRPEFQYSAYFMAYRYCLEAMMDSVGSVDADRVSAGESSMLQQDIAAYDQFYRENRKERAVNFAAGAEEKIAQVRGDEELQDLAVRRSAIGDLMVSWYIQEVILPTQIEKVDPFDPFDKDQVDVSDIIGA